MILPEGGSRACWFVMRDLKRPNAKLPAYRQLLDEHFEVFTPMKERLRVKDGKRVRERVPLIRDLFFVHDTLESLKPLVTTFPTIQFRYLRGGYRIPMTVPDSEMERFIRAVNLSENPRYFMPGELTPAMCGRKIRIVGGPLDGYEGKLLNVRGSRIKRLIVELPAFFSVGVEVNPEYIKLL